MSRRCRPSGQASCDCVKTATSHCVEPCTEPLVYGTNILSDPGFESQLANVGGGPLGDEIPGFINTVEMRWSDASHAPDISRWSHGYSGLSTQRWKIATIDPHSGTYHAQTQTYGENQAVVNLYAHGFFTCAGVFLDVGAAVTEGDYYSWSIWVKASALVTSPINVQHSARLRIQFFNSDGDTSADASNSSADVDMTTSYQKLTLTGFVPAGMIYMRPYLICNFGDGTIDSGTVFRADDGELELSV